MQWAYPERWVWWWLLPLSIIWWWWAIRHRRSALARFADVGLLPTIARQVLWQRRYIKAGLITIGISMLLLALVGPQWGFRWEEVTRRGIDLIIALDVSNSMLAEDVKPSRLERAKLAITDMLSTLGGDRIGLVAFAGTAFLQCPLTVDYGAFAQILDTVTPDTIPRGGTSLAAAMETGLAAFESAATGSQALILITDGESHEGDPIAVARAAAKQGITIFCIGIGTPAGELIPMTNTRGQQTFLKDRAGHTVKSRLDEQTLTDIAVATGGAYVRATATAFGLDMLYRERIAHMEQQAFDSTLQKRYEHRFQWPLVLGLLCLAAEPMLSDRRRQS